MLAVSSSSPFRESTSLFADFELDDKPFAATVSLQQLFRTHHASKTQQFAPAFVTRTCSAPAVFSTRPDICRSAARPLRSQLRCNSYQQACFASLLQSFSKPTSQHQTSEPAQQSKDDVPKAVGWGKHLLCGALSAVVSRTTMAPLERIKLEIVLHKKQDTMFEVALGVFDQDGAQGFWKGNGLNILRTAPYKVL